MLCCVCASRNRARHTDMALTIENVLTETNARLTQELTDQLAFQRYVAQVTDWINYGGQMDGRGADPLRVQDMHKEAEVSGNEVELGKIGEVLEVDAIYSADTGYQFELGAPEDIGVSYPYKRDARFLYSLVGRTLKLSYANTDNSEAKAKVLYYEAVPAFSKLDPNFVQDRYPFLYLHGAAALAAQVMRDDEAKNRYFTQYADAIINLNLHQGKRLARTSGSMRVTAPGYAVASRTW